MNPPTQPRSATARPTPGYEPTGITFAFADGFLSEVSIDNQKAFYAFGLTGREAAKIAAHEARRLNSHAELLAALENVSAKLERLRAAIAHGQE